MKKINRIFFILVFISILIWIRNSFSASTLERKKKEELYREIEIFSSALGIIESDYVEEVSYRDLIYGALKGMLSSLDAHSQFLDPESYKELKMETEGRFGGLGMEITIKDGLLTVVSPIEDTPAWKAGIKPADRIVKINGQSTRNITLDEAVKKLRGKPGTEVYLTILRESVGKVLDFKLTRDIIKLQDIKEAKILEDKIGYIRIVEFRENTYLQLEQALKRLKEEGVSALILDLRNNPGGLLDSAVKIAGKFIERKKLIVSTKGKKENQSIDFFSEENDPILDIPMVILVNKGSASGSEIVASALQDYNRAIILGEKTFGKGSVQTIFPLSDGSALKLTTSKYFTPKGRLIHNEGVMPDIVVQQKELNSESVNDKPLDIFDQLEDKKDAPSLTQPLDYKDDLQLQRAVDLLKAIQIYQHKK
ncbi:MAG: S41 family peptidase [Candidatus Omnitrophica bacterium]|nr:S41 family peptidase [Candidatus Omnitrophota bacterium]